MFKRFTLIVVNKYESNLVLWLILCVVSFACFETDEFLHTHTAAKWVLPAPLGL